MRNLLNAIIQKVLQLVLLAATKPEVYVYTINTFIYDSCNYLEDNLNHLKSLKLMRYAGENVAYFCNEILVYYELLDIAKDFKTK